MFHGIIRRGEKRGRNVEILTIRSEATTHPCFAAFCVLSGLMNYERKLQETLL